MQAVYSFFSNETASCAVKTMHSRGESWEPGKPVRKSVNTVDKQ